MSRTCYFLLTLFICPFFAFGQDTVPYTFGDGIKIVAQDSSFSIDFGARFQTLYNGSLNLETDEWSDQMMIRRMRVKFDGFAYDPRLKYKLELALSNRDNGEVIPQSNNAANIVLDAVLKYEFSPGWELWFGQTKLPGNRERLVSSQELQFVDRSQLNSRFTLDRGVGIQLHHTHHIGQAVLREIGSIAMGEGESITIDNVGGYQYTAKVEFLPFGEFTNEGEYFGADLAREEDPKLAIAVAYDQNNNTVRTRGYTGEFLNQQKDLKTVFVDAMFKYQGFSSMFEYADRRTDGSPVTPGGTFYTGRGLNIQMGYLFANDFEIAGRFTGIEPEEITGNEAYQELTLGLSRYIVGHNLKIQSDLTHINYDISPDELRFRFQVELAF